MAARLTPLIFQQYTIGFRDELKNTSVVQTVHATTRGDVIPPIAIVAETIPTGR